MLFRLSDVSKSYGSQDVLRGTTLQINPAEHVGLVGRNGAGKTTMFRLVNAEESPDSGEVVRARGLKFDLVIVNEIPTSYRQDVQDELQKMAEAGPSHSWIDRPGGVYLRRADNMSEADLITLQTAYGANARVMSAVKDMLDALLRI